MRNDCWDISTFIHRLLADTYIVSMSTTRSPPIVNHDIPESENWEAEIMNQKPDTAAPRRFFPGRNLKSTLAPSSEDNCAPKQSSSEKNKKRRRGRRGKRGSKKTDELMQEEAASLFEGRCYQEPEFYFCWELHQNTHGPFKGHTILLKIRLLYIHLCQKRFIGVDQVWISHNQDTLN